MISNWPVLVLLVVAQVGDELPERLPPPPGFVESPDSAPTYLQPAAYPPSIAPSHWPAPDALALPPPPYGVQAAGLPNTEQSLPQFNSEPLVYPPMSSEPFIAEPVWDEPQLPGTRFSVATLGAGTGFSTTTFDFNHTWLCGYGEGPPLSITPGWGIHFWGDGVGLGLPPRVYDLYVDLQWTPWTGEHWSVSVGLTPGLYTDFSHAGGDMFQLTGWIVGNRQLGPEWQLVLGAAYVRQLQTTLIPVGGVIWTPSEDIRLELIFPKPKYAVRYRETEAGSMWWFIAGQLGGGAWSVADGPGNDALVSYSDLRLVVGVEQYYVNGREWAIELGYAFDRQLSIDNHHAASIGSAFSLSASFAY